MNYGKAIKTIRAAKGISQKQLSLALGLDTSYLSRIEKGERKPSTAILEAVAQELKVPFYLFILLSSERQDFQYESKKEIEVISKNLLNALIDNEK